MKWPRRRYAVIEYGPGGLGLPMSWHWTSSGATRRMQFYCQTAAKYGWHCHYEISTRSR